MFVACFASTGSLDSFSTMALAGLEQSALEVSNPDEATLVLISVLARVAGAQFVFDCA